jgi:hypothetical protein
MGALRMTGIHVLAYPGPRRALGLPRVKTRIADVSQQLAVADLAPEGGFVIAAAHNIQVNDPAKNLTALWQAGEEHGRYPQTSALASPGGRR